MGFLSYSYLIVTALAFVGILIETFFYSGIIRSHFLFDIRILAILSIFLAVLNLLRKNPEALPSILTNLNKYIALPIISAATIFLSVIELLSYPNFVFSNFHINYDSFFYFFILSLSFFIFSIDKKKLRKNKEMSIFGLSIILIIIFFIIRTWPGGIFFAFTREDKLVENLQFVFYFFAALLSLLISISGFSKKNKLVFIYFLGFSAFLFFTAGEEISWGQRIIGISTPEIAAEINTQNETTIHNIRGLNDLQPIMYMVFSFYLSTAWIFIKGFPSNLKRKLEVLVPSWYLILYFVPIFIFYSHINIFGGSHWEWQEACELLLAIGLFIFMYEKFREMKTLR